MSDNLCLSVSLCIIKWSFFIFLAQITLIELKLTFEFSFMHFRAFSVPVLHLVENALFLSSLSRDELEYYTETECNTDYKQDCEYRWEGSGNNKVWAPIPGSCNNNAYDKCGDVQKQKLKQVPYQDCQNVPKQVYS